jgi:hypothetical protein
MIRSIAVAFLAGAGGLGVDAYCANRWRRRARRQRVFS